MKILPVLGFLADNTKALAILTVVVIGISGWVVGVNALHGLQAGMVAAADAPISAAKAQSAAPAAKPKPEWTSVDDWGKAR